MVYEHLPLRVGLAFILIYEYGRTLPYSFVYVCRVLYMDGYRKGVVVVLAAAAVEKGSM